MTPHSERAVASVRPMNLISKPRPRRSVSLGFVDFRSNGHTRPEVGKEYRIISAASREIGEIRFPETRIRRLDLDLYAFFCADLPDLWKSNEGLVKIGVDTRNPQDIEGPPAKASFVTEFNVRDGDYAPGFLFRGVFRNVLFEEWVNLAFDLFELDTDSVIYYDKLKKVLEGVPEIKDLDVLRGLPFIGLASRLFDGIIRAFGKNPDDHIWGELPILEREPLLGGAYLRDGVYILFETQSKTGDLNVEDLVYQDGQIKPRRGSETKLSNLILFGTRILPHGGVQG